MREQMTEAQTNSSGVMRAASVHMRSKEQFFDMKGYLITKGIDKFCGMG